MKISTKGRYAVRILLDIALHQGDGYVTMRDVARRQQISKKYADQVAMQLTQSGLLVGVRGHQGGYRLGRAPQEITVLQVLQVEEGSMAPVACLEQSPNQCTRCGYCLTLPMWQGLEQVINSYLGGITLQALLEQGLPQPELEEIEEA